MQNLKTTKVYKLTLNEEIRIVPQSMNLPKVISLDVNEMKELVQMGRFDYETGTGTMITIRPSDIYLSQEVVTYETLVRANYPSGGDKKGLEEFTPQEALSLMTDIQIIEEESICSKELDNAMYNESI